MASEGLVLKTKPMIRRTASTVRSLVISGLTVLICRKKDQRKKASKSIASEVNSRRVSWQYEMNLIAKMVHTKMREKQIWL